MNNTELDALYDKIAGNNNYTDIIKAIDNLDDKTIVPEMRLHWCNEVLDLIAFGYIFYDTKTFSKDEMINSYIPQAHLIKKEHPLYEAVAQYYLGNEEKCLKYLEKAVDKINPDDEGVYVTGDSFSFYFLEPFKNAFKGFWNKLGLILQKKKVQEGIVELCKMLELFYATEKQEERLDLLIPFSQKYPDISLVKELIASTYYSLGMWRNAIAYFHMVEGCQWILSASTLYFSLAWCYSKIKDFKQEEYYYRKSMESYRAEPFVRNNLGYCLMKQKKYEEALSLFEECLRDNTDLPYAANNYVKTLIALGRNKEAKKFVNEGKFKVSKDLVKKVGELKNVDSKPILIKKKSADAVDETETIVVSGEGPEPRMAGAKAEYALKMEQFSSEKILEDELTARIESGREVFGLKLKVYNHKGDYYGRQYPFPNGRLDLLCEDDKDDLYIIELKKDAGYDDVFKQVSEYLDYFKDSKIAKGKKVHGIICLNDPPQKLIDQVKSDDRMRLFEYQISYREVK